MEKNNPNNVGREEAAHVVVMGRLPSEFHYVLYNILEVGGHEDLIWWQDQGVAVRIDYNERFAEEILKERYGYGEKSMKFSSFRRQLNRYGFHTETRLCPINNYKYFFFWSENFQNGRPELLAKMHPKKKKKKRQIQS